MKIKDMKNHDRKRDLEQYVARLSELDREEATENEKRQTRLRWIEAERDLTTDDVARVIGEKQGQGKKLRDRIILETGEIIGYTEVDQVEDQPREG